MSKVLIVGGAGYVGGWFTDSAIEAGHEVRVIDNLTYEDAFLKDVDFHFTDITDFDSVKSHLSWSDCVIWLAGLVGDPACAINPSLTMAINVESVRNLCNNFDGRVIFPSTCSVYGAQDGLLTESSPTSPLSLYAETKIQAEEILMNSRCSPLIFRLGTLFGLSDKFSRLRVDLVLNVLTIRAVIEGRMSVFGGNQYRPLLHVKDVATAGIKHIDTPLQGIYNLHTENVTILQLAERIHSLVPNSTIEQTPISFQDARNYQVSSNKAEVQLGFKPKFSIEDGIKEVRDVVLSKRIKDVTVSRFNNYELLRTVVKVAK